MKFAKRNYPKISQHKTVMTSYLDAIKEKNDMKWGIFKTPCDYTVELLKKRIFFYLIVIS